MFELANTKNEWDWCYSPNAFVESHVNTMGQEELLALLDALILSWNTKNVRPSHVFSVTEIVGKRVNELNFSFYNKIPIPVCYFTDVKTIGASLLQVYLEVNQVKTVLHGIKDKSDLEFLLQKWENELPQGIIFSFSSFHFIGTLNSCIKQLLSLNTKLLAGGLIFNLDKSLTKKLPGFVFPNKLPDLVQEILGEAR